MYKFNFISTDNYELEYTNKNGETVKKPFTRSVKVARDLESIQAEGRAMMLKRMTDRGETREDYIIKRLHADGTITYDESNLRANEEMYIGLATLEIFSNIIKNLFNMELNKLFEDMGLDLNSNEEKDQLFITGFLQKFSAVLTNGIEEKGEDDAPPSIKDKE